MSIGIYGGETVKSLGTDECEDNCDFSLSSITRTLNTNLGIGRTWEKFSTLPSKKKHKNSKPQSEMKTFSQCCRVALVEF